MPWLINVQSGGGSGGGIVIDPELLATLQKIANPNLLYNSTGMMNMGGWITHPKTKNFRDEFIIDDFSYYVTTGNDAGIGFVSASLPVQAGKEYTFSGEFVSPSPIKVSILFQDSQNINSTTNLVSEMVLFEETFGGEFTQRVATFTPPTGTYCCSLKIEFLAADETEQALYQRLKIEEGNKATAWIPCLTDPYQNNVFMPALTAADFV